MMINMTAFERWFFNYILTVAQIADQYEATGEQGIICEDGRARKIEE